MLPPSGSRSGPRPPPRQRRSKRRFSSFLRRAHSRGRACRPSADAAGSRVDPGLSEKTRRPDPPARAGCAAHGLGSTGCCHRARTSVSIPRALSALVHYRMQHFTLQAEQHDKQLYRAVPMQLSFETRELDRSDSRSYAGLQQQRGESLADLLRAPSPNSRRKRTRAVGRAPHRRAPPSSWR